jgi:hypothetical protein
MPLNGAQIMAGATSCSVTGGSSKTFTPDGQTVANGIHLIDASQPDYRIRENMTIKQKVPTIDSAGVYSKDKKSITIVIPKILESGKTVFNLIRIEREVHPESTSAEATELLLQGAQVLFDSDFASFWSAGSLA